MIFFKNKLREKKIGIISVLQKALPIIVSCLYHSYNALKLK